jgi:hypothetical protein
VAGFCSLIQNSVDAALEVVVEQADLAHAQAILLGRGRGTRRQVGLAQLIF